jgi:ADP-ribosyl-[dinitrogen reductase] hydrolase
MTGAWQRDLDTDLKAVAAWGATALVTLMESHELELLRVPDIGHKTAALNMQWLHLPIRDVSIPDANFEAAWETQGRALLERLTNGQGVVVHCRGGLGRTGLIAARLLIELGEQPARALSLVRQARPGAVETRKQEEYALNLHCRWLEYEECHHDFCGHTLNLRNL